MAAIEFHPGKIVVDSVKISSTQSAADVTDLFVEFALDSSIVDYTAVDDQLAGSTSVCLHVDSIPHRTSPKGSEVSLRLSRAFFAVSSLKNIIILL